MFLVLEVDVGEPLLVFTKDDSYISFSYSAKIVITIISDVKAKLFHYRNAGDVSNSVRHPAFKIFAKNTLPIFCFGTGDGATCITVSVQLYIANKDFR